MSNQLFDQEATAQQPVASGRPPVARHPRERKLRAAVVGVGVAVLIVALLLAVTRGDRKPQPNPNPIPERSAQECGGYPVRLDRNEGNRLVSEGLSGPPEKVRQDFLAVAQQDPRVLQLAVLASPLKAGAPAKWEDLLERGADGQPTGCLSKEARDLYQQVRGAYMAAAVSNEMAPAQGTNTGVYPGGSPFQEAGIGGNREATKVVFPGGSTMWILHRCGNVVLPPGVVLPVPPKAAPTTMPPPAPTAPTTVPPPPTPTSAPKPPPTTVPSPPTPTSAPKPPLTPKDPAENIDRNPQVPDQVRKTGPSPDNAAVVAQPPRQPVDSPTGCNGPCPTSTPATPPSGGGSPSGVQPVSPPGGSQMAPPPTVAPEPAPPVTGSPTAPLDSP